jgi:hypothetical protein
VGLTSWFASRSELTFRALLVAAEAKIKCGSGGLLSCMASGGLSVGVIPQHPSIVPGRQSPNRLAGALVWKPESPGALKLSYSLQTTSKLMPTSDQCHVARLTVY